MPRNRERIYHRVAQVAVNVPLRSHQATRGMNHRTGQNRHMHDDAMPLGEPAKRFHVDVSDVTGVVRANRRRRFGDGDCRGTVQVRVGRVHTHGADRCLLDPVDDSAMRPNAAI